MNSADITLILSEGVRKSSHPLVSNYPAPGPRAPAGGGPQPRKQSDSMKMRWGRGGAGRVRLRNVGSAGGPERDWEGRAGRGLGEPAQGKGRETARAARWECERHRPSPHARGTGLIAGGTLGAGLPSIRPPGRSEGVQRPFLATPPGRGQGRDKWKQLGRAAPRHSRPARVPAGPARRN